MKDLDAMTDGRSGQRLVESEVRMRSILDGMLDPVVVTDAFGTILYANESSTAVFGYEPGEWIGENIRMLTPEPYRSEHDGYLANYRRTGETQILGRTREFPAIRKDGVEIAVELSVSRIDVPSRGEPLFCGSFREITARKETERAQAGIRRAQKREMAMMRSFAEIGESASLLAHEIRNPITAVSTTLQAVARHLGQDERDVLGDLVARMQKMEALMKRTLSLVRPLDLQPLRRGPAAMLESAVRAMQPHLDAAGIECEVAVAPDCPWIVADAELMEQVLTNLIRNALDAMERGGRIRMEARAENGWIVVQLDDDGPGIPKSVQATLFKPFVSTKAHGTGLGLAFARKVVEAHQGTIAAFESPLGGARFEIRLPVVA
ncbi:MAG TPA: PAS domain S-box protein [Planctomycetota bacterium]